MMILAILFILGAVILFPGAVIALIRTAAILTFWLGCIAVIGVVLLFIAVAIGGSV